MGGILLFVARQEKKKLFILPVATRGLGFSGLIPIEEPTYFVAPDKTQGDAEDLLQ